MADSNLLITDLDGTLLGDDVALAEFAEWYEPRRHRLRLVYNSGRFVDSVSESIALTDLPQPDAIIGGVGTQIQCCASGARIADWPGECLGWQPLQVCAILSNYSELVLQPAEFLSEYKISYFAEGASVELIDELRCRLAAASCHVQLVFSSNRDVDILPAGINKGSAAKFVSSRWNYDDGQVMVCGDTANDLAMLQCGFRGIVVGNARGELKRIRSSLIYQAEKAYAAGVLEGLLHWLGSRSDPQNRLLRQPR